MNMSNTTLVYDFEGSRYVNLTNRCSMKCTFCPRTRGDYRIGDFDLKMPKNQPRPTAQDYIELLGDVSNVNEVVFCGFGESTERLKPLLEIATWCKEHGVTTRLNTNGHGRFYNKRCIVNELKLCIDKMSVSLNAQTEELYNQHCVPRFRGAYKMMLDFCQRCVNEGIYIEMSAIDGLEGVSISECETMASNIGAKFKYRKLNLMIDKERTDV